VEASKSGISRAIPVVKSTSTQYPKSSKNISSETLELEEILNFSKVNKACRCGSVRYAVGKELRTDLMFYQNVDGFEAGRTYTASSGKHTSIHLSSYMRFQRSL
jgi:hypothetical protein